LAFPFIFTTKQFASLTHTSKADAEALLNALPKQGNTKEIQIHNRHPVVANSPQVVATRRITEINIPYHPFGV
jgi:hypothetical protein